MFDQMPDGSWIPLWQQPDIEPEADDEVLEKAGKVMNFGKSSLAHVHKTIPTYGATITSNHDVDDGTTENDKYGLGGVYKPFLHYVKYDSNSKPDMANLDCTAIKNEGDKD